MGTKQFLAWSRPPARTHMSLRCRKSPGVPFRLPTQYAWRNWQILHALANSRNSFDTMIILSSQLNLAGTYRGPAWLETQLPQAWRADAAGRRRPRRIPAVTRITRLTNPASPLTKRSFGVLLPNYSKLTNEFPCRLYGELENQEIFLVSKIFCVQNTAEC